MTTLIAQEGSSGTQRCDAHCHNARRDTECRCVCRGRYHGVGIAEAVAGLRRDLADGALGAGVAEAARIVLEHGLQLDLFEGESARSSPRFAPPLHAPGAGGGDSPAGPAQTSPPRQPETGASGDSRLAPSGPAGPGEPAGAHPTLGAAEQGMPADAGAGSCPMPSPGAPLSPASPGRQGLSAGDAHGGAPPARSHSHPPADDPTAGAPGSAGRSSVRRCACGRVAKWGSTRCSVCDPWIRLAVLRGVGVCP